MARIFISHSSLDNAVAAELKLWLQNKGFQQTFLDFDKDGGIQPGAEWERTLYREVERAQAVVIVVTDHWLKSKWCFAEFAQARALGKAIFPLIIAPTGERIVGEDLQNIDLTTDREGGLERLGKRLTEIALQSPEGFDLPKDTVPFPGLAAFEERHAAVFFGRDPEIRELLERLRRARTIGSEKLITLLGASGSGKSSLLRAGIVPRLKRDRENWIVCRPFRPEGDPVHRLIDTLLLAVRTLAPEEGVTSNDKAAEWREQLASASPASALREIARTLRQRTSALDAQILIPIDQAEELFTMADAGERRAFFALLDAMLAENLPFVAIAALRSDHLGEWQKADGLSAPFLMHALAPMPLERIGSLVRGPARLVDLKVDDDMIAALIEDAESEDALPLIAFLLRRMFETFGTDKVWTLAHYQSMGNRQTGQSPLQDAVRRAAEEALPGLTEKQATLLREAFVPALVRVNAEGGFVRKPARLALFSEEAKPLLRKLIEARLLVTHAEAGDAGNDAAETIIEVAHEALFRVWPQLAGWLEEERDFLIGKARLDQAFRDWQTLEEGKRRKGLLSGIMLERARLWLIDHPGRFDDEERTFIRESDRAEAEDGKRRERMRRNLLGALAALVIVLFAGLGASGFLYLQQVKETERADREAKRATDALAAATETANGLIFNLAQRFRNTGLHNDVVREILEEARKLQDRLNSGDNQTPAMERSRAAALVELGGTLAEFGAPDEALKLYEESLEIFRRLAEREPENTGFQRDVSVSLNNIADIRLRQDPAAALKLYEEGLEIAKRLAEREPENTLFQHDVSFSLDRIADIRLRQDPAAALKLYVEGLEIAKRLAEREPENTGFQRDVSVSLNNIADIRLRQDPAAALKLYVEGLEIRKRLAEREPENTGFQRDVSVSLNNIADIRLRQDPAAALKLYEEGLEIRKRLAEREPENTGFQRDVSFSLDRIADIRLRQDPAAALKLYEEGLEIRKRLAEREPENTGFQRDVSVSLDQIADIRLRQDPAAALKLYEEGLEIAKRLAEREPENTGFQRDVSFSLDRIADIRLRQDPAAALRLFEEGLEIRKRLAEQEPDNIEAATDLVVSHYKISTVVKGPTRRQALQQALDIALKLQQAGQLTVDQAGWPDLLRQELVKAEAGE